MKRLAGSDSGFLFIESPTQTSTCVDLVVLEPPGPGIGPLTVDDVRRHLAHRLHDVPALRWRVEEVPGGVAHPVWIEDPDFDLDHHVRQAGVAPPGGDLELDAFVATALPGLLDRRHPLWQVVLVDGLDGGRQALVFRFHHALADGAGLIATIGALLAGGDATDREAGNRAVAPAPSRLRLLLDAVVGQVRAWIRAPRLLLDTLRRFRSVEERRSSAPVPVPRSMGDAPACVLNRSADAERSYARARLELADLRLVRAAAGTTLSDVVLAVVAGALRSYLLERDQLPDRPLVANVPVGNDEPAGPPRQTGNVFANYFTFLATDVEDPRERLAAVAEHGREAKAQLELLGRGTLPAWLDRIPPAVAGRAARAMARRRRSGSAEPDFNVLVSNVRTDPSSWSIGGRRVEHFSMSGPVADGAGLNITVTGAGDEVTMAIVANPAAVDRPHELAAHLERSLAELVDAFEPAVA